MQNSYPAKRLLTKWFKGTGKPNPKTDSIHRVITYRAIMGISHSLELYSTLEDQESWGMVFDKKTREQRGALKHMLRNLQKQGIYKNRTI